MDDSMGAGFMAVIAVSGSIVFLSLQVHKRLLSEFMEKIEFELGSGNVETKKRVRFRGKQQVENREREYNHHHHHHHELKDKKMMSKCCEGRCAGVVKNENSSKHVQMEEGSMPRNWQALYKGILQYRKLSAPCI